MDLFSLDFCHGRGGESHMAGAKMTVTGGDLSLYRCGIFPSVRVVLSMD